MGDSCSNTSCILSLYYHARAVVTRIAFSLCAHLPALLGSDAGDAGALTSHESGYPMFKHAHIEEPHIWKARTVLMLFEPASTRGNVEFEILVALA